MYKVQIITIITTLLAQIYVLTINSHKFFHRLKIIFKEKVNNLFFFTLIIYRTPLIS